MNQVVTDTGYVYVLKSKRSDKFFNENRAKYTKLSKATRFVTVDDAIYYYSKRHHYIMKVRIEMTELGIILPSDVRKIREKGMRPINNFSPTSTPIN